MPGLPSSTHCPTTAETGSADDERHELTQTQAQNIQSPVSTYPELPDDWKSGLGLKDRLVDREHDFTEEEKQDAWKVVDAAVKTYSDEMVQRWIVEMDTLLVYAGLFSAVLTAFNVESYSLLSPTDPDPVLAALTQISAQLASFSVHDPFVNSTQPAFQSSVGSSNSTSAQAWAVWLNALWFSSFICSLSAASVAIMVKQWIHEYNSGISGTSRHTARLRQHRYNGLVQWKVAAIIAVLPILLQIALGLFLAGLLVLLWSLNRTVAIVASTLVGALLAFTLVTIILPTLSSNCAYLSPLSISLFRSYRLIHTQIQALIREMAYSVYHRAPFGSTLGRISHKLWGAFLGSLPPSVYAMQSVHVTRNPLKLDQDVFVTAYSVTGDLSLLEQASTCFSDHPPYRLDNFLTRLHAQNRGYGQPAGFSLHWTHFIPLDMATDMLLVRHRNTSDTPVMMHGQPSSGLQEMMKQYLYLSHAVSGDHRISYALSNMAAALYSDGSRHPDNFPLFRCLYSLKLQMKCINKANHTLTEAVWRRVIAAIYTILRTRHTLLLPMNIFQLRECGLCLYILMSYSSPSASRFQPGVIAEEDTKWKPLADAIALAEDETIRTLQCSEFRDQAMSSKCHHLEFFFHDYEDIGREQLARRVSAKMLRALMSAVQDLSYSEIVHDGGAWKHHQLERLQSLENERDKLISTQTVEEDKSTTTTSRTT